MKHKYYDAIVAWAEGKLIQSRSVNDDEYGPWKEFQGNSNVTPWFQRIDIEWRVKPEKKVMWYKIFRFPSPKGLPFVFAAYSENEMGREDALRFGLESLSGWIMFEYE